MTAAPIPSDAPGQLRARWTTALVTNGVFGPVALLILTGRIETASPWWDRILVGIAVAALLLWVPAIRETLRWLRFRRITLVPDPPEGSLGGHLGGSLRLPGPELRDAAFRIDAVCLASEAEDEPGGPSVHWIRSVEPRVDPGANGVRVTFALPLPDELPPTGPLHRWAVRVAADLPGADLDLTFPVPVDRHHPPLGSGHPETDTPPGRAGSERVDRHISIESSPGTTLLRYRTGRSLGSGVALGVFGSVFLASGIFAGRTSWQGFGGLFDALFSGVGLLFLTLFGLIGGLLLLFGIWQIGNGLRVEAGPRRIRVTRRFFFLPGPTREWPRDEIDRIEVRVSGQQLRGARTRVEYSVRGVTGTGGRIPLGDGIQGPIRLERVTRALTAATGLPVEHAPRRRKGVPGGRLGAGVHETGTDS